MRILLRPASWIYSSVASRRFRRAIPPRVGAPVICVGNPTVGGAGKTPTAIAIARVAQRMGRRPGFVSRGYGAKRLVRKPVRVEPDRHAATEVGDEPLLLAGVAPTVVSVDRVAAARLALSQGCDLVIMDDGFQSRRLHADEAILIVDRAAGIGNGLVVPSGPLRMPFAEQLNAANTLVCIDSGGKDRAAGLMRAAARAGRHVVRARSRLAEPERWRDREVVAFCGLGDPSKFTRALEGAGANILAQWNFPDHHTYTDRDIRALKRMAEHKGGALVTTAKDAARLRTLGGALDYEVADVSIQFEDGALEAVVRRAVQAYERRR